MLVLFFASMPVFAKDSGMHDETVNVNGKTREYIIHLPAGYTNQKKYPVVLSFHGGGGNAKNHAYFTEGNKYADKYGYIIVYPQGTPAGLLPAMKTWNSGYNCCGKAHKINSDDTSFTEAIIEDISKKYSVDQKRIYATGMSNGGMMSYKLACQLSDKIAAIAPVAGTLNLHSCNPTRPVPVLHFHGTEDKNCRFEGGVGVKSICRANFKSVPYSIEMMKNANMCTDHKEITYQSGDATCMRYTGCKDVADVVLCKIKGMGHVWPGGKGRLRKGLLGNNTRDINANDFMWDFFKDKSLK